MMKVGIITLLDEKNYGNRWQNYAMNKLINSMGIETVNIYYWINKADRKSYKEVIKRIIPKRVAYLLHVISLYEINSLPILKRVIKFEKFTRNNMNSKLLLANSYESICKKVNSEQCDYFAAGSDQVWNPYYVADLFYFLQFAEYEKRLAFIASFGCDKIPEDKAEIYKKWISEMKYISVREPSGADIVKELSGKEAPVFLDPTLLLDLEDWEALIREPKHINLPERYGVSFMFSNETYDVAKICEDMNLKMVVLNDKRYGPLFSLDPSELLFVLRKASIVFTDSFHIMALSIKLHRQFYVFKRVGFDYMFGRLESTLERLDICQCIYEGQRTLVSCPISGQKYDQINKLLRCEKDNFLEFVRNVVTIDEE